MKIYIVTAGYYSDYRIEKVFSNRPAAEEYIEWREFDEFRIEEHDVFDDYNNLDVGDKKKFIRLEISAYINSNDGPHITTSFFKTLVDPKYRASIIDISGNDETKEFNIWIIREIPENEWEENFQIDKYTKVLYDNIALVKSMINDGASFYDIYSIFRGKKC